VARTVAALPAGSRITDYISLGVIARFFPVEKVREVLEQTKRASVRQRDLPAHVVIYYVIALVCTCAVPIARSCGASWKAYSGC
jgi:Insertion element 4 transposase N-terminal